MLEAISKAKIVEAIAKSESSRMKITQTRVEEARDLTQIRLRPKDNSDQLLEALDWVPKTLVESKWTPENLRSFGSPWLLHTPPGLVRSNHMGLRLFGIGQFILVHSGSMLVIPIPFQVFSDINVDPENAMEFIGSLDNANVEWQWAVMQSSTVVWSPYTHVLIMISLLDTPGCTAITVPYVCAKIVDQVSPRARSALLNAFQKFNVLVGTAKSWAGVIPPLVKWLEDCGCVADTMQEGSDDEMDGLADTARSELGTAVSKWDD